MFTWICPKCGAEVPPHENECPRCLKEQLATAQQIAVPAQPPPQAPPPPPQAPPPQQPPPQYQGYPGQYPYPPPQGYPQQPYPPQYGQQPPQYPQTQYYPQQPGPGQPQMLTSGMMPAASPQSYTGPTAPGAPTAYTQPPPPPAYAPPSEVYNTTPLPSSTPAPNPPPPPPPPPPVSQRPLPIKDAFSNAPPPPPPSQGLPSWAIVLLVAALLIGAGYAGISFFGGGSSSTADVDKRRDKMEPVTKGASGNPFTKHLELTGIRVAETRDRKLQVRMVVINHSGAELPDLNLSVALKSTAAKAGDPPITQFKVKLPTIGAYESRELKADATTQLRAYEFPDWQFLRVEFEILDK